MIHVITPGLLTSVQDLGRRGFSHLGVGGSGAMDDIALRLANALVGNDDNAAGLEITMRGPTLRFDTHALVAFTGGEITGEFLLSTGYLPGAHDESCPVYRKIAKLKPPWMRAARKPATGAPQSKPTKIRKPTPKL